MNALLPAALVLTIAATAAAAPPLAPAALKLDPVRLARIDGLVAQALAAGEMSGCVVCIGRRAGIGWLAAYGDRQIEPSREPMTSDTIFDLASLTKPVSTATAVMLLVEDGAVRLGDPISLHLPEFTGHGKEALTVHQLLTHQSGLIADNPLADYEQGPAEAWKKICGLELVAPPGTRFIYSDVNFIVLGRLVETLSGRSLDTFTRERVFTPLGMSDTGYLPSPEQRARAATTEQRDGGWIRGEVHDPRAWKLGGVAGHAGLFGTATDLARYARALLGGGELDGSRIMAPATLARMVRPVRLPEGALRGLGWDERSGFSSNRGDLLSPAAFGHGGFTGTSLWIDPGLDLFVIFLSSRLHPDGKGTVNPLAGRIGSVAAGSIVGPAVPAAISPDRAVLPGIDVLARDGFRPLAGRRVGLITNHTGRSRDGVATARLLADAPDLTLVALFSPEHGHTGQLDQERIADATDADTGLPVRSLYGKTRRPTAEMLADIDTLVFDIQDIGTRFYTYISTMLEAMKAASEHGIRFVVLDRPNPINGRDVAGPVVDAGSESFVGCHPIPLRHGMTVGELARMFRGELDLDLDLVVVPCEGWRRRDAFDATGLEWVNPSPNMRSLTEAFLYPGIGLLEFTNLSVGRGTDTPFEVVGAPWLDGRRLAAALSARRIPGVAFVPIRFTPTASRFSGEPCGGVNILITDRDQFDPIRTGLEIAVALRRVHRDEWQPDRLGTLLLDGETLDAILRGDDGDTVLTIASRSLRDFVTRRSKVLAASAAYPE
ncbi:MAG: Esterase EstB [Planctomycetota bacterium]